MENPSPNLSPPRREALIAPPSLVGKGVGGLGLALTFHVMWKSQINAQLLKITNYVGASLPFATQRYRERDTTRWR
ncbi:S-layer region-like protein [Nostoc sp. NIES-3756]|nr:S-layer region-like protein [Nostoc sp. NIES-3756]BAY40436.1 S-layer region-like protein [Nostoc sp. NIES-2111]